MKKLKALKILFVSTPVGPLGSGLGGGVELTLKNIAQEMKRRGHQVNVIAPAGSKLKNIPLTEVEGRLEIPAQQSRQHPCRGSPMWLPSFVGRTHRFAPTKTGGPPVAEPPAPLGSALKAMWTLAEKRQNQYDLILNFAYDTLPFELTFSFKTPIFHLVSMASLSDEMDQAIEKVVKNFPSSVAVHSLAQAKTFSFGDKLVCIGNGIDLSLYKFCPEPEEYLTWIGRISPEKGLEDVIQAVKITQTPLKILGKIQEEAYWRKILKDHVHAPIDYVGFFPVREMQKILGRSRALLMTPHWIEAFGNVAIEALACGVPVITYARGGPTEIVRDGKTGWLVEADNIDKLVEAIGQIDKIDRRACRKQAEKEYSLQALGDRIEKWLKI